MALVTFVLFCYILYIDEPVAAAATVVIAVSIVFQPTFTILMKNISIKTFEMSSDGNHPYIFYAI